jgi:endonuclease VIII
MPEGDTIFRSARALHQALAGQTITLFETAYAPLASVNDQSPVAGRTVEQVESRGKWLLIHFSGDLILTTHMLMSGSWHIYRVGERWKRGRSHMRIVLGAADLVAVAFDVSVARFHTARTLERFAGVAGLGPDLLGKQFAADEAAARMLERGDEEVGNVLLNQRIMAGIGNVFKSEICFACAVHPFRKIASLSPEEVDCLLATARRFLAANVADGARDGIVTYTGGRRTTGSSNPASRLWVYHRAGEDCRRCGTTILTRKQGIGARSTFWCPDCQKAR